VISHSFTTHHEIHQLLVSSSRGCIGSAGSGLGGRLASLSGLGGSGFGLGIGVGGDEGGCVGNLVVLLLKVPFNGGLSFFLEII